MDRIAVYGAGGLGREIMMLVQQINLHTPRWEVLGYFDDKYPDLKEVGGFPVLGNIDDLNNYPEPIAIVVALGHPDVKQRIVKRIRNPKVTFPILIHPSVQMESFQKITIGEGSIITAGNIFTVNIQIGKHVLVNLSCTIGHDVSIGDFSAIMPGVQVSGAITMKEGVFVGTGAMLIRQAVLGEFSVIGAGAVVRDDVSARTTVVGVPAHAIKRKS